MNHLDTDKMIEDLYMKYYNELYQRAVTLLGDYEKAEDVIQDTFVVVITKKETVKNHQNKKAFLYQVLNYCIKKKVYENMHRVRRKNIDGKTETKHYHINTIKLEEGEETPLLYYDQYFEEELFEDYKELLTEREFLLLTYKYKDGLTVTEIADRLHSTYTNITTMTYTIHKKIKFFLEHNKNST